MFTLRASFSMTIPLWNCLLTAAWIRNYREESPFREWSPCLASPCWGWAGPASAAASAAPTWSSPVSQSRPAPGSKEKFVLGLQDVHVPNEKSPFGPTRTEIVRHIHTTKEIILLGGLAMSLAFSVSPSPLWTKLIFWTFWDLVYIGPWGFWD